VNSSVLHRRRVHAEISANAEIAACLPDRITNKSIGLQMGANIALSSQGERQQRMTLKIEKASQGHGTTIRLIGRMRAEHLDELDRQIRESGPAITLDLEEVTLVDVEIVRFLGTCEERGATILNCSPYIRDWIGKERD
jgi:hypothetical protein